MMEIYYINDNNNNTNDNEVIAIGASRGRKCGSKWNNSFEDLGSKYYTGKLSEVTEPKLSSKLTI